MASSAQRRRDNISTSPRRRPEAVAQQFRYASSRSHLHKPSRDESPDALRRIITIMLKRDTERELGRSSEIIVKRLVRQGLTGMPRRRIDQPIECNEGSWTFQVKLRLVQDNDD